MADLILKDRSGERRSRIWIHREASGRFWTRVDLDLGMILPLYSKIKITYQGNIRIVNIILWLGFMHEPVFYLTFCGGRVNRTGHRRSSLGHPAAQVELTI